MSENSHKDTKTLTSIQPNTYYQDRATGSRVFVLEARPRDRWLCMYPDGELYVQHERFLDPVQD